MTSARFNFQVISVEISVKKLFKWIITLQVIVVEYNSRENNKIPIDINSRFSTLDLASFYIALINAN